MSEHPSSSSKHSLKARMNEFQIPPIRDGLVLGKDSAIGSVAMRRALDLLISAPFEHIELEDEVISDILIRQGILRRVPQHKLIDFVMRRIKPLMGPEEIIHLELNAEVLIEEVGL
ncbi:MAG: hypothetical protein HYV16_14820 [Gammaproteobacteria bacterium]|nr:hypothetical protein [Gammaproteobacteria bacterium]